MNQFLPHSIDEDCTYKSGMLGNVKAGFPSPAEDIHEKLDLIRLLLRHRASTFFFRVDGVSMVDAGMDEGAIKLAVQGSGRIKTTSEKQSPHYTTRWCDIDLEEGIIDVNHTLVYYDHRDENHKKGCYFNVNTPKTANSNRQVPMLDFVKEAFLMEKENQRVRDIQCKVVIDGYTDFIFLNRDGGTFYHGSVNKTIRRIIRDCNLEILEKGEEDPVLLPHFSCHSLRHTFTTRMCEAGVNVKVIQDTLGHSDIATTLEIYAEVTKEFKKQEFAGLNDFFIGQRNQAAP